MLTEHGVMLADHTRRLDGLASDVESIKTDVAGIKGHIGKITIGMYTLENLIRQIVPGEETAG
jgi:hypothetical protein